jgi:hypothetical protein
MERGLRPRATIWVDRLPPRRIPSGNHMKSAGYPRARSRRARATQLGSMELAQNIRRRTTAANSNPMRRQRARAMDSASSRRTLARNNFPGCTGCKKSPDSWRSGTRVQKYFRWRSTSAEPSRGGRQLDARRSRARGRCSRGVHRREGSSRSHGLHACPD